MSLGVSYENATQPETSLSAIYENVAEVGSLFEGNLWKYYQT